MSYFIYIYTYVFIQLPSWDPTWCYPDDDEKMMIAAWDCWDINHNTAENSTTTSIFSIDSSSNIGIQKYFDLTKYDNKQITKFNQQKVSNTRGLVGAKISLPKDDHILSDNYETTFQYVETGQRETLIKSGRENIHKVSAKNDTTSGDSKSSNLTSAYET
jgi:hypothetical protein